jgi:hypothetical protein
VYVTGSSDSTWGGPVRPYTGGQDAFAARLDSSGNLAWNTFLGGNGDDGAYSIAVAGYGDVYIAGYSDATWGSPVRSYTGRSDAFVAKISDTAAIIYLPLVIR